MEINNKTLVFALTTLIAGGYLVAGASENQKADPVPAHLEEAVPTSVEVRLLSGRPIQFYKIEDIKENIIKIDLGEIDPDFPAVDFDLRNWREQNELGFVINKKITAEKTDIAYRMMSNNSIHDKNHLLMELVISPVSIRSGNISDEMIKNNAEQILAAMKNPDSDPMSVFGIYTDIMKKNIKSIVKVTNRHLISFDLLFKKLNDRELDDISNDNGLTNFPNRLIQKMLLKKPSEILKELHDLVDQKRLIFLYMDKTSAILMLLLDPNLLLGNPSLFYSYIGTGLQSNLFRDRIFDINNVPKHASIIETIKSLINPNLDSDKKMIPKLISHLSNLKDVLLEDKEYKGDTNSVIRNIDEALNYLREK